MERLDLDDQRRHRRLTMAPILEPFSGDEGIGEEEDDEEDPRAMEHATTTDTGERTPLKPGNRIPCTTSSICDANQWLEKFWALGDESEDEDTNKSMPHETTRLPCELSTEKVRTSPLINSEPPCSSPIHVVNGRSKERVPQNKVKPWIGPLPKPRISPPKTLGDAMIKNSHIRL
jgi:hypothetical protein